MAYAEPYSPHGNKPGPAYAIASPPLISMQVRLGQQIGRTSTMVARLSNFLGTESRVGPQPDEPGLIQSVSILDDLLNTLDQQIEEVMGKIGRL